MVVRTLRRIYRHRWLSVLVTLALVVSLLPASELPHWQRPPGTPAAVNGPGPVDRPLPDSARSNTAPAKAVPLVPPSIRAAGPPRQLSTVDRSRLPRPLVEKPGLVPAGAKGKDDPADNAVFEDLVLRPGYVLGDTSLVLYFNLHNEDRSFDSWVVHLFDAADGTEQASQTLHVPDLDPPCHTVRTYCRSLDTEHGWTLDATKEYFVSITAVFADGHTVLSAPSTSAKPRTTIVPPAVSKAQAAGCGCGDALGMTEAGQAVRGTGVNTATGAFSRVERDLSMTSFGIEFSSVRTYSSALVVPGAFGPGWAWDYGMAVTASDTGATVRAEDGAEAFYRLDGTTYVRPPGIRSNLSRVGDGWQLVTPSQDVFGFDAQGRLVSVLNPRQAGVRLAYTATGLTITDASGRTVTVTVDSGLIKKIALPDGRKTTYGYTQGRLTSYTDARGNTWKYAYSTVGLLTDVISPIQVGKPPHNVVDVHNEYDADGKVVRQTDGSGNATRFEYPSAEQTKTTDPDGVVTVDVYKGNVLVGTERGGQDPVNHRYDGSLNRTLVVNGKENQHEQSFDTAGNVIEQKAPLPFTFSAVTKYDAHNNPIEHTDANGNVWKDSYDSFDELVQSTDAEGNSIHYDYDPNGLLTVRTDQRGKVTRYEYFPLGDKNFGLLKATVSPEARRTEFRYDPTGRRVAVVDPRGTLPGADSAPFTTTYTFDAGDLPTSTLQPGKTDAWRTTYDADGRVASRVTPSGAKTTFAYLDNSLLSSVTDPRKTVSYTYTPAGRKASERLGMGGAGPDIVTTYGYNAKGLMDKVTSPRGNVPGANPADFTTTYIYDGDDNLVRLQRPFPGGQVLTTDVKVDELDRTTATVDENAKTTSFARDNTGNVTASTDTLNRTTTMDYDRNGRQKSITDAKKQTTGFAYDAAGNKISQTMPEGGVTTWAYDGDGLLISTTDPRGNVPNGTPDRFTTRYRYDLAGNPQETIDPLGHITQYEYDADDRLTSTTDARGGTVHYTYTVDDQVRSITGADAPFDPRKPEAEATVYDYDPDGQVHSVRDPLGHTSGYQYDPASRLTVQTDPLGRRTERGYDVEGNLISTITLAKNEKPSVADRARRTVTDTYDIVGRHTQRSLGSAGPVYTYGYDAKDRTTFYGDPAGKREVVYDDEDQIKSVTRTDNTGLVEKFGYDYDTMGNVTNRTYPDGTKIDATYDKDSRLATLTESGGTFGTAQNWSFTYDVAGRLAATTLPASTGLVEGRAYDDAGRLIGIQTNKVPASAAKPVAPSGGSPRVPATPQNNNKPRVPGAPTGVSAVAGAAQAQVSWKPPSDPGSSSLTGYTVTVQPGGRTIDVGAATTSTVVDALDPGTAYTFTVHASNDVGPGPESKPSNPVVPFALAQNPVSSFLLDLDPLGNPTRVLTARGGVSESVAYSYDKANRVTSACYAAVNCSGKSAGRIDYSYDLVGNRTSQTQWGSAGSAATTYQYDAADELTKQTTKASGQTTTVDFGYDLMGDQTKAGADTFSYNLDHSLAKATVSGRTTTFGYDANGLRLTATTGTGTQASTQRWSWDVNGTLPQIALDTVSNSAGQLQNERGFVYGPDDAPMALLDPGTGAHPYTHDWLGGVADMLAADGTPEQGYDYDPYGNPRLGDTLKTPPGTAAPQSAATGPANPLRYTGQYQDNTTGNGNYYLRARTYNPDSGRFTSTDPVPEVGSAVSPYSYGSDNPLAFTDPTGTEPHDWDTGGGTPPAPPTGDQSNSGPSADDVAKAHQLENKSWLDIVLEAGGQILMEILGIDDIINCLKGDIGACVMAVIGNLPWGKIFKAKRIAESLWRVGKAIVKFIEDIKWAKAILRGAEDAAKAAAAAAAEAARVAAEKAAAAKELAERLAKKAAAEAKARAEALAARAKAALKKGAQDADNAAKNCLKKHSFAAGTLILLADGTTEPIDQAQPGDTVLATDPVTGQTEARQITRTIRTVDDTHFVDLTVRDGATGGHTITTTEHHPFWSVTQGRWVDAGTLRPGDLLRTSAGTYVQVGAVRQYDGQQVTYDLTIDTTHTYYVVAGTTPVLVHNDGDDDYLFRGVWPTHPDYADALNGDATPTGWGKPGPKLTPAEHNAGMQGLSDHTSWTTSQAEATRRAQGGVVLKIPRNAYPTVASPDYFNEGEVLVHGPVCGAERVQ